MFSRGPLTAVRLLTYLHCRRYSPFPLPWGSVGKNLLQENIFIFYDSQIRRIILAHVNSTGQESLPLSLPMPSLLPSGQTF